MLLVLDVTGKNDLDLNSARTEIVYNDKWNKFESDLSILILKKLSDELEYEYWDELRKILLKTESSEIFIDSLKQSKKTENIT